MPAAFREIIGREDKLAGLERLLADPAPSAAALVLVGEAGIGKTTVWLAGLELASRKGLRVLSCRPAEAERMLPYAALGDLLEPVLDDVLERLPEHGREQLEAVLGLAGSDEELDRLAVSRAWLTALRLLAENRALVLAVDDVQWLDAASTDVLRFAARRVGALAIRLLIARRDASRTADPLELATTLPPERLEILRIGPLSADALDDLLRARLALELSRPKLVRLHELSNGNPFYAIEIAAAAKSRGAAGDGSELRLPESLADVVTDRLKALPADAHDAVLLTAACPQPTEPLIGRALGTSDGLAAATAQGILRIEGSRLRFTHPLLASAAYEGAAPWERREAHRRLAAVIADSEERARQLGLSADEPDEEIAAMLEHAAETSAARGGLERAAFLVERAAELTPSHLTDDAARRSISAAVLHESAGDVGRARELLEALVDALDPGSLQSEAQLRLLTSRFGTGAFAESEEQLERLLEELDGQPSLRAEAHASIGETLLAALRLHEALRHFRGAAELAEEAGDLRVQSLALGDAAFVECMLTCAIPPTAERAVALWSRGRAPLGYNPRVGHGVMLMWLDVHDAARDLLLEEAEALTSEGAENERANITLHLTELELRAGNWSAAAAHARQTHLLARQAMNEQAASASLYAVGLVDAHFGNVETARNAASSGLAGAEELGDRWFWVQHRAVLGFLELSLGNATEAHDWLGPAADLLVRMDVGELSIYPVLQNEIEALVALGQLEAAEAAIGYVEDKGRAAGRAWHEAIAARGRALVAAERGDLAGARGAIERALSAHERLPQPFELGRTLLVQGMIERRARHHGAARNALLQALEVFDALGAPLWSEKAATELARVPGRRRDASAVLTETERRVAELVAQGLSNKQVAAALFVSVRTVEAALTRIYRKLGVRSRTELAARLQ